MCDEDEPKAKRKKREKPAVLFLGRDTNHWSLIQRHRVLIGFVFCYHARLVEWLLNLGENVVLSEDNIGLSTLFQGHEVEEATDDKYLQPGKTKTVEEAMVLTIDCVAIGD